tara:strand:- start:943 stop:1137 length:195 start_codon:yes stop_codon:yes gene_type:complete
MRNDVKNSLLQAYGAALMVDALDAEDLNELSVARGFIRSALKAWDEYDAGKLTAPKESSDAKAD